MVSEARAGASWQPPAPGKLFLAGNEGTPGLLGRSQTTAPRSRLWPWGCVSGGAQALMAGRPGPRDTA